MDIKELAAQSVSLVKEAALEYSRLKGFSLNSIGGALRVTVLVVKKVEEIGLRENLQGADKNALAVELLLQLVKLPWWMPVAALRAFLPPIIDAVVDALKDKFGK